MGTNLHVDLDRRADHAVLHLDGQLSVRTAPAARRAMLKSLIDVGRVVVDVSRLQLANPECVALLPSVLNTAGGWPTARLVVVDAEAVFEDAARRVHCSDLLPFYPATEAGVRHVDDRPARVRRDCAVPADPSASATARRFLQEAAADWDLSPDLTEVAQLVVSELVSNAVEHAGTASTVALELTDETLKISVRDGSTTQPVPRPLDMVSFRGRGLPLIDRVSQHWGILDHPDGKTVWATLSVVPDESV
ncbi:ATP-binding protein [Cryptosporangium arvum]|uniref:ATP-binding protein n=1 Tax=Cryptosporangium arvum TaxID=80871 RepID=UPI0004ACFA76|nr:ATP-binding protein [Cryptosporangium arvum]